MNRFDFLGVSGVGKSTVYKLLGQSRQNPNEFFLFSEAYDLALMLHLPLQYRFANKIHHFLEYHKIFQPFDKPLSTLVNHELSKVKFSFERDMQFEQITRMWREYPDMLFLRLNGAGRHFITEQKVEPSEYLLFLLKTALIMRQFNLINQSLPEKAAVVVEKSFTQMIFFNIDFSKEINPDIISRYIRGMPLPAGVIIFNAIPELIISRLRQRAKEGWVATFHRDIIDTDLLEEWVNKACKIVQHTRNCLLDQNVNVFELNAGEEPQILANNIRDFIIG